MKSSHLFTFVCLFAVSQFIGCGGPSKPALVTQTVTVKTGQGKPVNHVLVRFVPQVDGLDGNDIATGVTDAQGTCVLTLPGKEEPGCFACLHKVMLKEGPLPDDARRSYGSDGGAAIESFNRSLKYRPIPKQYGSLTTTPLSHTPAADGPDYEIVIQ